MMINAATNIIRIVYIHCYALNSIYYKLCNNSKFHKSNNAQDFIKLCTYSRILDEVTVGEFQTEWYSFCYDSNDDELKQQS